MGVTNNQKPSWIFSNTLCAINNDKSASKCQFLLSLTIWSNNFLGNNFALIGFNGAFNAFKHLELPYINCSKKLFCNSNSKTTLDSTQVLFPRREKDITNIQLWNLNYLAKTYLSIGRMLHLRGHEQSCLLMLLEVDQDPKPFFSTCSMGKIVFEWSILLCMMHKNFSLD